MQIALTAAGLSKRRPAASWRRQASLSGFAFLFRRGDNLARHSE
jgi:hypothetical protein